MSGYAFVPKRERVNRGSCDPTFVQTAISMEGERQDDETFTWGPKRVYFLRAGDAVKIGVSQNVSQRMREIRTANSSELHLIGVLVGGEHLEGLLHHRFREHHIRGEWFRLDILPDILDMVAQDRDYFEMRGVTLV